MLIVITGCPASGKTTIAKELAKKVKLKIYGVNDFTKEKEIDLEKLYKKCNNIKNGIMEGHIFSEIPLNADFVFLIKSDEKILRKRMKDRGYSDLKIEENIFCNNTGYFEKALRKNYKKFFKIENKEIEKIVEEILKIIKRSSNI